MSGSPAGAGMSVSPAGEDARHFFRRIGAGAFAASPLVEGAWNRSEQHIAPALGLIAHAIERDAAARRDDPLAIGRVSYDILGTIPIGEVAIEVVVLRPGRTIELVEARMTYDRRPVVLARAWLLRAFDTAALAGTAFPALPPVADIPHWPMTEAWAGACIGAMEVRRARTGPGRAQAWLRTDVALIAGEAVSGTARALGLVDIANGVTMHMTPERVAFPNLDLTVHLLRAITGEWVGIDTTVSVGAGGIGLTHSVLHDVDGPVGTIAQCLTVRPR
jgi:hypothetical protein